MKFMKMCAAAALAAGLAGCGESITYSTTTPTSTAKTAGQIIVKALKEDGKETIKKYIGKILCTKEGALDVDSYADDFDKYWEELDEKYEMKLGGIVDGLKAENVTASLISFEQVKDGLGKTFLRSTNKDEVNVMQLGGMDKLNGIQVFCEKEGSDWKVMYIVFFPHD